MRRTTVLLLLLAVGCDRSSEPAGQRPADAKAVAKGPGQAYDAEPESNAERRPDPTAVPDADDGPKPTDDPLPDDAPEGDILGPASDATPEQRREAVLALLAGGEQAETLPVVSVDEGKMFNPGLADQMAPRALPDQIPRVRLRKSTVDGDLAPQIVARIARRNVAKLRECYERFLQRDPGLGGDLELALTIAGNGRVTRASQTEQDLGNEAVGDCMALQAKSWKFPKPADGKDVSVTLPINVSAG
jgi:hypothetical protein